jgi:F-type H+-transporting ATPase subunit epsilon
MSPSENFHCSVVTPERAVLECEAKFVALPAWDGEIGILRGRAPLLCKLGIGRLRIETATEKYVLFVDGGFAEMLGDQLTILTEDAKTAAELDRQTASSQLEAARALTVSDDASFEARQKALERARAQLRLAD